MRIVFFSHSLLSDWNHGNAHFLRGVVAELHAARPRRRASTSRATPGASRTCSPSTARRRSTRFRARLSRRSPARATTRRRSTSTARSTAPTSCSSTSGTTPTWCGASARTARGTAAIALLFHDTHHRVGHRRPRRWPPTTSTHYDGVLAFGDVLRDLYLRPRLGAARLDLARGGRHPRLPPAPGDRARRATSSGSATGATTSAPPSCTSSCIEPVRDAAACTARVHGVRYPDEARAALAAAGIDYAGWLPNFRGAARSSPAIAVTVHVPRRPYVEALPGIPTIRAFEALACGIPLVSRALGRRRGAVHARAATYLVAARRRARCARHLRDAARTIRRWRAALAAHGPRDDPARATPAPTASTSCWRSCRALGARPRRRRGSGRMTNGLTSPSSARAWSPPTGTAPPPTTAASSARSPRAATAVTFYEPDAFDRQQHRDIADPAWATVVVYPPTTRTASTRALDAARGADLVVKASGVGVFDELLEARGARRCSGRARLVAFWDVDAPATLDRVAARSRPTRSAR